MKFDPRAYRERSLAIWGKLAPAWKDRNEWMISHTGRVNDWIVERADPQPGDTVLEIDSVDAVVCRWGYMLMADPAIALKETRRVLREGGLLAFAVWAPPDRNPWAAVPAMTLVQQGHMPPPEPDGPGIFAMGDPDRVRRA